MATYYDRWNWMYVALAAIFGPLFTFAAHKALAANHFFDAWMLAILAAVHFVCGLVWINRLKG